MVDWIIWNSGCRLKIFWQLTVENSIWRLCACAYFECGFRQFVPISIESVSNLFNFLFACSTAYTSFHFIQFRNAKKAFDRFIFCFDHCEWFYLFKIWIRVDWFWVHWRKTENKNRLCIDINNNTEKLLKFELNSWSPLEAKSWNSKERKHLRCHRQNRLNFLIFFLWSLFEVFEES